jgi:hypothetical protein
MDAIEANVERIFLFLMLPKLVCGVVKTARMWILFALNLRSRIYRNYCERYTDFGQMAGVFAPIFQRKESAYGCDY